MTDRDTQPYIKKHTLDHAQTILDAHRQCGVDVGIVSDGYHTFNELYELRKAYNVALFNEWAAMGKYDVHKSKRHHGGSKCFDGTWFIVVATLPTGQISNHYKLEDWDLFQCEAVDEAKHPFDGHAGHDVIQRLKALSFNETHNLHD